MIGRPHPDAIRDLTKANMLHLLRNESVRLSSVSKLLASHNVKTIQYFKLDVEGFELKVFRSLLRATKAMPSLWPHVISYESRWLTPHDRYEIQQTLIEYKYVPFTEKDPKPKRRRENVLPDTVWARSPSARYAGARAPTKGPGSKIPVTAYEDTPCSDVGNRLWVRLEGAGSGRSAPTYTCPPICLPVGSRLSYP